MKILQLCNKAPYPSNDGSSIAIYSLAEGLADNHIELHLLAINTKKHFKPDNQVPVDFVKKTHYQSIYKNTNTSAIGALFNLITTQSYFVSRFFFTEYETALIQKLTSTTFDIIQLEGVFMASYIPTIKKYSNALITLRAHNIEHQIWERHIPNEKNWVKKKYLILQNNRLKAFELESFHKVNAIITITDEDKRGITHIGVNKPIYTCLTGINLNSYQLISKATNPLTLFHFASMDWLPNIEAVDWLMDNVWQEVLKKMPNAQLILAGRGMPERFKKLASKNITVIENVEHSKDFYKTYDIMLVPLWSGSGLRIKLVEGLAYGKAIITTCIGAEGIPYNNEENLIVADSKDAFVAGILTLLTNSLQKQQLQLQARLLAENNFDYKKIAHQLVLFYFELLKNTKAPMR